MAASDIYIGDSNLEIAYQGDGSVPAIYLGDVKVYPTSTTTPPPTPTPSGYSDMYLTIEVTGNANSNLMISGDTIPNGWTGFSYSLDDGRTWHRRSEPDLISLTRNAKVLLKSECQSWNGISITLNVLDPSHYSVVAYGNVLSLLFGDDFAQHTGATGTDYCLAGLFKNCICLTDASNLVLPYNMTSLHCLDSMFYGCTSLTTSPVLTTPIIGYGCYEKMFYGCSSLTAITCLATYRLPFATNDWVNGVAASGTFYKSPNMNDWPTGSGGIPDGWSVVDYTG